MKLISILLLSCFFDANHVLFRCEVDWNLPRLLAIRTKWSLQRRICPWGQGRFPAPQQGSPWKEGGWRWGKIGKNRR